MTKIQSAEATINSVLKVLKKELITCRRKTIFRATLAMAAAKKLLEMGISKLRHFRGECESIQKGDMSLTWKQGCTKVFQKVGTIFFYLSKFSSPLDLILSNNITFLKKMWVHLSLLHPHLRSPWRVLRKTYDHIEGKCYIFCLIWKQQLFSFILFTRLDHDSFFGKTIYFPGLREFKDKTRLTFFK